MAKSKKKVSKKAKPKKKANKGRIKPFDPFKEVFNLRHLFFLFGIAMLVDIILMIIYLIAEKLSVAPIMSLGGLPGLTSGESVIFYQILQVVGIWTGLVFVSFFFKWTRRKL